ncbi:MAG: hypothetical protein ACRDOJ_07285, partial [Nocardioidaceae bacterium]
SRRVDRHEEDLRAISDTVVDIQETVHGHTGTLAELKATVGEHGQDLAEIKTSVAEILALLRDRATED